jgi:hypothetical protein
MSEFWVQKFQSDYRHWQWASDPAERKLRRENARNSLRTLRWLRLLPKLRA